MDLLLGESPKIECPKVYDLPDEEIFIDEPHEITSLIGNISMRDGAVALHAHVTLGDRRGNVRGGHLLPGTPVFACEAVLCKIEGPELTRGYDEITKLPLWNL